MDQCENFLDRHGISEFNVETLINQMGMAGFTNKMRI